MKTRLIIVLLISLTCQASAQKPASPANPNPAKQALPDPLLRPAPEFSRWTITYQYADDDRKGPATTAKSPSSDRRPRRILTTKTKTIIHEEQTDGSGLVIDTWHSGRTEYVRRPNEKTWYQTDKEISHGRSGDPNYNPLPSVGFRGMDLVTEANFAGSITYGSGRCFVFVPGGTSKLDLSDESRQKTLLEAQPAVAYVDADSRLPVAVRSNGETRTFRFGNAPTEMQTFPAELTDQLVKAEEALKRLQQPAPRPY